MQECIFKNSVHFKTYPSTVSGIFTQADKMYDNDLAVLVCLCVLAAFLRVTLSLLESEINSGTISHRLN